VYEHHLRLSDRPWSTAIWQSIRLLRSAKLEAFENPQHLNVSTAGIERRRNTLKEELLRR
jgi:hypothetical protein